MANTKNKQPKLRREPQKQEQSALDAAIAAAISAPPLSKKASQYQNSKKNRALAQKKSAEQKKAEQKKSSEQKSKSQEAQKTKKPAGRRSRKPEAQPQPQPQEKPTAVEQKEQLLSESRQKNNGRKPTVKIISLGGLNEIGKNMYLIETADDIVIIDCGMTFPDDEMLGVDIVIPDFTYVERNASKVRGVVLTHGHEDHIGGIPYLLKKLDVPIYGTKLTLGLLGSKLKEHNLGKVKLNTVSPGQTVKLGGLSVEFIRVNHSIPDAVAVAVRTPAGIIVHTGDFKVDYTPIEGGIIDLPRFAELGSEGVLALMADSTNSERHGFTPTERNVGATFDNLFNKAGSKRIIIATFSSNVHRIQQIIDCAEKHGRKVAVFGRSMVNVIKLGVELGYLRLPDGVLIDIDKMRGYTDDKIVLITTGSQGEPMSALTRMALNDHRQVSVTENDFIIISARPIPGNEKFVGRVVNELLKLGAEVVYEEMYEVHVSGHACQEEQKLMLALTRPKFFIPVHGEFKHLSHHADTARSIGLKDENIVIAEIGNVIETDGNTVKINGSVTSGKVMVDGYGVGDVGAVVLKDRQHLAQDGVIVVNITIDRIGRRLLSGPDVISRGFVYERENEELIIKAKELARSVCEDELKTRHDYAAIKNRLRDELGDFFFSKTKRRPMVIPDIMDI